MKNKMTKKLLSVLLSVAMLLSLVPGMGMTAYADNTCTVTFKANGRTVSKEVTLPHTFSCNYSSENGEFDLIIKELYQLDGGCCGLNPPTVSGSTNVTGGISGDNQYITVNAPFEGTATFDSVYFDSSKGYMDFEIHLEISCTGAVAAYSVTITPGSNMTKTSGEASQTGLSGPMTAVVYTANDGYKFPETSEAYTTTNGITVAVSQDQKTITVSGTPTADTSITIPDAVEELLTTITATGKEQANYSTANVATVSFSYTAGGSSAYLANWGWWGYGWTATVNAAEGYTITKCVFYDDANRTATDSSSPFVVETTEEDKTPRINGTPIDGGTSQSKGLKKIEVYGYATPAHTHNFTYSASGATITATCGEGCDITEGLTLTISAPTGDLTADGTKTFPATLSTGYNTTAFPGTYAITYTKDGAEFTGTPTEAGEYTASVTVGTATASVSYTVYASKDTQTITASDVTATYGDTNKSVSATTDGNGTISYAVKSGGADYIDVDASTGALTIKKVGTATVIVTAAETATYSQATKEVTVTINKANPTYTVPTGLTATYGDTLGGVTLPTGWAWANGSQSVGNAGTNTFKANFTPSDTANYNTVSNVDVSVTVNKATPSYAVPSGLTATYGDTLGGVTLPTGWAWANGSQSVGNAGTNTFKANFTPSDTANYNTVSNVDVSVTVNKATPSYTVPSGLTATYGDTLGGVTLPTGWSWADGTQSVGNAGTKTFKATFTPADTTNYNTVSNIDVTVKVNKASPSYTVPTGLTATYGDTLSTVTLPEGWEWEDEGTTPVGTAGSNVFKAKFTPNDTDNYNAVEHVDVTVTVGKATPAYTVPTGLNATYGDTLSSVALPDGWEWEDEGTTLVGNAGSNVFKAKFTPDDTDNYNAVEHVDVTVTVGKATPAYTVPTGLNATYGDTLADVLLPDGWEWETAGTTLVGNVGGNVFKAKFTPNDTDNYNVVEHVDVTVTVSKATPAYTVPTGLTATYGDTLSSVALPDGWEWEDEGTTLVGNVGNNVFQAKFTPDDTDNYNVVEHVNVTVSVGKATPAYTVPTGLTATYGDTLSSVALPDGWEWEDEGTTLVGTAGSNVFKAKFTPDDTDNYNVVEHVDVTVTVGKATPAYTVPTGLNATYGDTLSSVALPDGWEWEDEGTTPVGTAGSNVFKAKFTPDDTDNYNAVEHVDVTVTVGKATPAYTVPTGLNATYGDTLSSVALPDGWEWEGDGTTLVGTAGSNVFKAKFTPDDTDNYNTVEHVDVTVTVGKAASTAASVAANEWTFDGTARALLTVTGEAAGGTMQYALGTATAPGTFGDSIPEATAADTYYVWYKVAGDANHNDTDAVPVTVTVAHDEALDAVIAAIDAIGPVTEVLADQKAKIDAARAGYEDLTPAQQQLVTNYATLVDAEAAFKALFVFDANTQITISGVEKYGETLTATAIDVPTFITDAVVRWYNEDGDLLGTGATYTLTAAEIGKSVRAELYSAEANDTVTSDFTGLIGKGVIKNYTLPTAAHVMYPQTLAEATLTGGDTGDIEGVWAWVTPDAQPTSAQSGSSFELIFTPTGIYADLYEGFTTRLAVIVDPAPFEPDSISDADEDITLYGEFADGVVLELTPITHNQSAYLALLRASSRDASGLRKLVLFKTMTLTGAEEAYNGTLTLTSFVGEKRAGETVSAWFFIDGAPVNYVGTVDADGFLVIEDFTL